MKVEQYLKHARSYKRLAEMGIEVQYCNTFSILSILNPLVYCSRICNIVMPQCYHTVLTQEPIIVLFYFVTTVIEAPFHRNM